MASFYRYDSWVKTALGPAVPGAQIFVCTQPANSNQVPPTPLALIYSDPNGLVPIAQPIITDGFGHVDFYALPGLYTVIVANGGIIQQVYPDQSLGGIGTGSTGGTALSLEINGTPAGNQLLQNLVAGPNITLFDDGVGDITISGATQSLVLPWFMGAGYVALPDADQTEAIAFTSTSTAIAVFEFELIGSITVHKLTTVFRNSFAGASNFGIYSSEQNLLIDSGNFNNNAGSGVVQTNTLVTPVSLATGKYFFASATTQPSSQVTGIPAMDLSMSNVLNATSVKMGYAGNGYGGSTLPATLGGITAFSSGNLPVGIPMVFFE